MWIWLAELSKACFLCSIRPLRPEETRLCELRFVSLEA